MTFLTIFSPQQGIPVLVSLTGMPYGCAPLRKLGQVLPVILIPIQVLVKLSASYLLTPGPK